MEKNVYAIKGFTSYFDRKVRLLENFSEYIAGRSYWSARRANFPLNDGITASLVFNLTADQMEEEGTPNYVLVCSLSNEILSRWYVIECDFMREGQYSLTLRRDVVADYMSEVLLAPCFIERGPLLPSSPYIFNQDGLDLNQIKVNETLLTDESGVAWIVGYVSSDTTDDSSIVADIDTSVDYPSLRALGFDLTDDADPTKGATYEGAPSGVNYRVSEKITSYAELFGGLSIINQKAFWLNSGNGGQDESFEELNAFQPGYLNPFLSETVQDSVDKYSLARARSAEWTTLVNQNRTLLDADFNAKHQLKDAADYDQIVSAVGKTCYDNVTQKYYLIKSVRSVSERTIVDDCGKDEPPALWSRLTSIASEMPNDQTDIQNGYVGARAKAVKLSIAIEEVMVGKQASVSLSSSRKRLTDAPYDMFCMEFNPLNYSLAQRIVTAPPGAGKVKKIYDLQILPYCPRPDAIPDGAISSMTEHVDYEKISVTQDGVEVEERLLFWCAKSSGTFFINKEIRMRKRTGILALDLKLADVCDLYRLTSPNYAASFEFSVARNGGKVSGFRVDYTYRPQMPYIHVAPIFAGLYGTYNRDARGLICNGDFSVDMVSDPWTDYMSMNKNFESIFNVGIQRMDDLRQYERASMGFSGIMSTGAGLVGGAVSGGPAGAIAGAFVGAARGVANAVISEGRYAVERKAAIDTFKYELGNVKAAPNSLTKVSAYNANNKYFPILEYYSCTDEEWDAVQEYLWTYNYRIGCMATIGSILSESRSKEWEYVKGRIAHFADGARFEDPHFQEEVYAEIDKGVFIYG